MSVSSQGLVLAGGAARRFGRDKVLEPAGPAGATLLEVALAALRPWCDRIAVLRSDPEPRLPESFEGLPLERLADPRQGPLQALVQGMRERPALRWLVAASDLPRLRARAYRRLLEGMGEAEVACFRREGRLEPLVSVIAGRAGPELQRRAEEAPDSSLHGALRRLDILCLDANDDERDQLWNVNRPEDLPPPPPSTPAPGEA